jgi:hypothetical protein
VPGARVERACPAFQTGASTATAFLANLVEEEGIEPSFAGCRPAVLPLDDSPKAFYLEPRARVELTYPDYKSGASPSMLTGLVILEPMERIERSSGAYHAPALPLSYIGWSRRGYSKPRPPHYGCGAPPPELLRRLGHFFMERVRRIELRWSDWRSDAQPIGHTRLPAPPASQVQLHATARGRN